MVFVNNINKQSVLTFGLPVGSISTTASTTAPVGWLNCQGQSISRTIYPALFALLGTTYGSSDANSFTLPDLRGEFLRGVDAGRNLDAGRALGSVQTDALQQMYGQMNMTNGFSDTLFTPTYWTGVFNRGPTFTNPYCPPKSTTANTAVNFAFDSSGTSRSAAETRPHNVALNYIIKY